VASPNPAAQGAHVPLISNYWLSTKKGNLAWLKPVVDKKNNSWYFGVQTDEPEDRITVSKGTKTGRAVFGCILTGASINNKYINKEADEGRIN
jgi:putative DNA methylase